MMEWLPFTAAIVGCLSLGSVVGFVVGVAWGVNFAKAVEAKNEDAAKEPLLTPQLMTDERIKVVLDSQTPRPTGPAEAPRPYRMPGLEDG